MGMTDDEREAFIADIGEKFKARLAGMANNPAEWVHFLEEVAVFGAQYSLNNQFMLQEQTMLRGIEPTFFLPYGNRQGTSGWLKERRHVRAGESAFYVWAPINRRPSEEWAKSMEAAGRKVRRDANGKLIKQVCGFRLSSTFDLSQTDVTIPFADAFVVPTVQVKRSTKLLGGKNAELLTGEDPTGAYDDVVKLIGAAGFGYSLVPKIKGSPGANGVTRYGPRVVEVVESLAPAQRLKTTIHELAHIRCEHEDRFESVTRAQKETEAESVAHIVAGALGLDTSAYSDAYVLNWAGGDIELVEKCARLVMAVSKDILAGLTPNETEAETTGDAEMELAA